MTIISTVCCGGLVVAYVGEVKGVIDFVMVAGERY